MEGDLRVQVAELFIGGRYEGASAWLGCSLERDLRVQVAGLFNGGKSEGASGWVVQWREV